MDKKTKKLAIAAGVVGAYVVVEGGNIIRDPGDTKRDTLPVAGATTVAVVSSADTTWVQFDTITDVSILIDRPRKPDVPRAS